MSQQLRRIWPYLAGIALFVAYWLWNGSISLSREQAAMHPDWSLHLGNIYFALFLCGLLLPIHVVRGCRSFAKKLASNPGHALLPVAAFALFWWQFRVDHPFNQLADPPILHNYVLQLCRDNAWCKAGLGFVAVGALCGLAHTKLQPRPALLLYPCAALALAGFWMIEPRYALTPLALWLAFRERSSEATEAATTALWAIIAACVCLGIFSGHFFL